MKSLNMGVASEAYLIIAIIIEILGGLMILLGWYTRFGCWLLMVYLIPLTFVIHGFWRYQGAERIMQQAHFMKNLAIYGGLVLLSCVGPGKFSVDRCRCTVTKKCRPCT